MSVPSLSLGVNSNYAVVNVRSKVMLGAIGNKRQHQRGFGMHSTLAVTTQGMPLGLLTQAFFTRPEDEPAHRPEECRKLPIEEKESYRWLQAFKQTLNLAPRIFTPKVAPVGTV